jgi:hypothetical protein
MEDIVERWREDTFQAGGGCEDFVAELVIALARQPGLLAQLGLWSGSGGDPQPKMNLEQPVVNAGVQANVRRWFHHRVPRAMQLDREPCRRCRR